MHGVFVDANESLAVIFERLERSRWRIAHEHLRAALHPRPPVAPLLGKLLRAVEGSARKLGYSHRRITSGAGHDACNMANVVPAAMVFVPCKDGVSHNELEDATQADCAAGANVLMHTVLALAGVAS